MKSGTFIPGGLPLHVTVSVLQFAVPEIISMGEARVLCKSTAAALAAAAFWRGMTVMLDSDEGERKSCTKPPSPYPDQAAPDAKIRNSGGSCSNGGGIRGGGRSRSRGAKPRSNADCLGRPAALAAPPDGGGTAGGDYYCGAGVGKRARIAATSAGGTCVDSTEVEPRVQGDARMESAWQFLRRYRHLVAFRRLAPPVTDTQTVDMPVPLNPSCLDACGCMVALGTREGPVILFHVGARSAAQAAPPSGAIHCGGGGSGSGSTVSRVEEGAVARRQLPTLLGRGSKHGGAGGGGGGSEGGSGGRGEGATTVTRVYGSLVGGEGPISAVLLDRAKVIAAGCVASRNGSGFVIRIYAVDSTRLLRTLRCRDAVSRMCLFDPVLAVHSAVSQCISFRDIYANGGSGLGQRTVRDIRATAFAPIEGQSLDPDGVDGVVLHCTTSNGTMLEASTTGKTWNSGRSVAMTVEGRGEVRGWHVCADLEAALLVRATPDGIITGWRVKPNGRRVRGPIFSFSLDPSSSARSMPTCLATSVSLAAGGKMLATVQAGSSPRLWDVSLARRRPRPRRFVNPAIGGGSTAIGGVDTFSLAAGGRSGEGTQAGGAGAGATTGAGGDTARWMLARVDAAEGLAGGVAATSAVREDVGGGNQPPGSAGRSAPQRGWGRGGGALETRHKNGRPRCVEVRPWPNGVWAVGVTVAAGSGRMVSACSDGRMRLTHLRPNNEEQRLRAAVLRSRSTKP